MNTLINKILIESIGFGNQKMYVELNTGRILSVPFTYTKRLENATIEELKSYKLIGKGLGIHFDRLDEDISLEGLLNDFKEQTKRINISVSQNFLYEADKYAKEHKLSRSALLQKATINYIYALK
mgnify:CR=1 FL=1